MKVFIEQVVVNGEYKGDIYIESDSTQYMINFYNGTVDKHGKAMYTNKGYYGTLAQAIKGLVKMKIGESKATTLHQLLTDIKLIEQNIDILIAH